MAPISKDIQKASEILKHDELVAIPTETVYGLAGNGLSETAVKKIFELKQRPLFNPLILHTYSLEQIERFVSYIPEKAQKLAQTFWPGSLTLVLDKKDTVPDIITAGKDTVAVRIPDHPLTLELLKTLDFPLAAPSANPFGCISPTQAEHVTSYFPEGLQLVLDGGACKNGIESTIVGFEGDEPIIYRLGSIATEDIINTIGGVTVINKNEDNPEAPGMLSRHYAPETTTYLVDDIQSFITSHPNKKIGAITFHQHIDLPNIQSLAILSPKKDLKEAASNLYATMHKLDQLDLDIIVAERFPEQGLGKSINDRLDRATKKK